MTPDGMDHLVELLDSAIGYVALDRPDVVPALAEARDVIQVLAAQERAELAAELAAPERPEPVERGLVERVRPGPNGFEASRDSSAETRFSRSAVGVRAALEEVLGYHEQVRAGREPDVEAYERARDFLDGLAPMPGQLGRTVAEVFYYARPLGWDERLNGWAADPDGSKLEESLNSLSRALGGRWAAGEEAYMPAVGFERVAGLQDARDTALDRAIGATLRSTEMGAGGKPDPTIAADATSWAGVHETAVRGLAQAGAADAPRARMPPLDRGFGFEESLTVAATNRSPVLGPQAASLHPWW